MSEIIFNKELELKIIEDYHIHQTMAQVSRIHGINVYLIEKIIDKYKIPHYKRPRHIKYRNCLNCNNPFALKYTAPHQKLCSGKCNGEYNTKNNGQNIKCLNCEKEFWVRNSQKNQLNRRFCSCDCVHRYQTKQSTISVICSECHNPFDILKGKFSKRQKNNKTGNMFCGLSCASKWGQANKTTGFNRSVLETWIENHLYREYPNLLIQYNNQKLIGLELDIYIPSLKIAFEINGPLHYKPIYGQEKLDKCIARDAFKISKCKELDVDLIAINIVDTKHFRLDRPNSLIKGKPALDTIINKIKEKLAEQPTPPINETTTIKQPPLEPLPVELQA